jgi:hypothetical protein
MKVIYFDGKGSENRTLPENWQQSKERNSIGEAAHA